MRSVGPTARGEHATEDGARLPTPRRTRLLIALVLIGATILGLGGPVPDAGASPASAEQEFLHLLNGTRMGRGLDGLVLDADMSSHARSWSASMARSGGLGHDPGYIQDVEATLSSSERWTAVAENVGYGSTVQRLHDAFVQSPAHLRNMIGSYNTVGIGVHESGGRIWVTFRFANIHNTRTGDGQDSILLRRNDTWHIRHTPSGGPAETSFAFGPASAAAVVGDWDGDGVDTVGVRTGNEFRLRNSNTPGAADVVVYYGRADDAIYVGDWDGDGRDTLAVRRGRQYFIRNDLRSGNAHTVITYGKVSDATYVGDWNGNGRDTLAVRRGREYHLRNDLRSGVAHIVLTYGWVTDEIIVGDWDGRYGDSLGVRRGRELLLSNSLRSGPAQFQFEYGSSGDEYFAGDA